MINRMAILSVFQDKPIGCHEETRKSLTGPSGGFRSNQLGSVGVEDRGGRCKSSPFRDEQRSGVKKERK